MKLLPAKLKETLVIILVAVPVLGFYLGGIYWMPAVSITKGREPWLSLLLAGGLAITLFGLGLAAQAPILYLGIVWVITVLLLLLVRRLWGALDSNIERFGVVHALALTALFLITGLKH